MWKNLQTGFTLSWIMRNLSMFFLRIFKKTEHREFRVFAGHQNFCPSLLSKTVFSQFLQGFSSAIFCLFGPPVVCQSQCVCVCVCVCVYVRAWACVSMSIFLFLLHPPLSLYMKEYVCMQRGWKNKHRITLKTVDSFQLLKGDKSDLKVNLVTQLLTACEAPARPEVCRESFQPKLLTLSWSVL